jgi:hypothetical protein
MPKGPNSDDVDSDVTDDVADDVTEEVTEDVTDDATDNDASESDQDNGDQGGTPQGRGGKSRTRTRQQPTRQEPADDPTAGLKKALTSERARARQLEKDFKDLQRKHATAEERQLLEAKESAAAEAIASTKEPLIKALATSELKAANVQGSNISKLVRLLDLKIVEIGDDGEISGLEDQIEELKEEFPNLFTASTNGTTTRVPNVNGGSGNGRTKDRDGGDQKPKGFAQLLAEQVTGAIPPGQGMVGR